MASSFYAPGRALVMSLASGQISPFFDNAHLAQADDESAITAALLHGEGHSTALSGNSTLNIHVLYT